ncbi:MAG: DUF5663 domain-containing protein [Gordonia sp. (in: high G+C Gram-positive bacteria)]|uniref:DUF5663 domain-containing protein n=1 Tax=Gordonia sp. (in: high G+C Gram-positive bacteria) TaxID=84139 RepID=UPI0039E438C3
MFRLDEQFLIDCGLAELPADQHREFLQSVYETLEREVGAVLSAGLSDAELWEFEKIIDRDPEQVATWLAAHAPEYRSDPVYRQIKEATGLDDGDLALRAEFAAVAWLELHRPDHRETVCAVMAQIKDEITRNSREILAAVRAGNR